MVEKSDELKQEAERLPTVDQRLQREEALKALRRLREIGESLPVVDAVSIVREGRDMADQGSN